MARTIPISYTENYTTKDTRFIINDIICVGYSIVNPHTISMLFAIHQDLFDKYEYLNMNVEVDSDVEKQRYRSTGLYIKDMQDDPEAKLQLQNITKYLTQSNLYTTDFNFERNENDKFYITKGIRNTGKNLGEVQEYQIDNSMYIQIRLFIEFLSQGTLNNVIFLDDSLKNVTSITPLFCKLDGTIVEEIVRSNGVSTFRKVISHYTFQAGPTEYKINYSFNTSKKITQSLREPMTHKQYEAQYGKDPYVTCTLDDLKNDLVLVVVVNDIKKETIVIRLDKDLYDNTNLKDPEHYIFYNGIEVSAPNVVPHIKFKQ